LGINADPNSLVGGGTCQLEVSAIDQDGDSLYYLWESTGGEFTSPNYGNTVTWHVGNVGGGYIITAWVSDGLVDVSDSLIITVTEIPPQWLIYDDGTFEEGYKLNSSGWYFWERFTRPTGWTDCRVTQVKVYVSFAFQENFDLAACDNYSISGGYYFPSGSWGTIQDNVSQGLGWHTYTISPYSFESSDFFVAVRTNSPSGPYFGFDTTSVCALRSGYTSSNDYLYTAMNLGLRAYVENAPGLYSENSPGEFMKSGTSPEVQGKWLESEFEPIDIHRGHPITLIKE
jgi:hypothetical protein